MELSEARAELDEKKGDVDDPRLGVDETRLAFDDNRVDVDEPKVEGRPRLVAFDDDTVSADPIVVDVGEARADVDGARLGLGETLGARALLAADAGPWSRAISSTYAFVENKSIADRKSSPLVRFSLCRANDIPS